MILRYGIDTSVLVRLVTKLPPDAFEYCVKTLTHLVGNERAEIYASNQVIGETYVVIQHHYGVSKPDARQSILDALGSGLVRPLSGQRTISVLKESGSASLVDRLICDNYSNAGYETLTLDRQMAKLPNARLL